MKTGFSIFITIDQPYITFYNSLNPGEYTFPAEGGLMQQRYGDGPLERSLRFTSSSPYSADVWSVASVDGSAVPDWLTIVTIENYGDAVNAMIYADALPAGTLYREATLRFHIPGAYIDYVFKQGEKSTLRGDVNLDGAVSIADVTALIDYLLSGDTAPETADCNLDEGVSIADVTTLIDYLLNGNW